MDFMNLPNAVVAVPNVSLLSEDEYTLARRNGLGASDASVLLGLQSQWKTSTDIIMEKTSKVITEAEREVGRKDVVRKGRDLEPLILQKFERLMSLQVEKPPHMYSIIDFPFLTVNYDGIANVEDFVIPVEAKWVSPYGDKYYDRDKALVREHHISTNLNARAALPFDAPCEVQGKFYGIPAYYYAQVQQQIMGLHAPYGYLVALHDKGWEACVYGPIPANPVVQEQIKLVGFKTWQKIQKMK